MHEKTYDMEALQSNTVSDLQDIQPYIKIK